jgi:hypothetical protein
MRTTIVQPNPDADTVTPVTEPEYVLAQEMAMPGATLVDCTQKKVVKVVITADRPLPALTREWAEEFVNRRRDALNAKRSNVLFAVDAFVDEQPDADLADRVLVVTVASTSTVGYRILDAITSPPSAECAAFLLLALVAHWVHDPARRAIWLGRADAMKQRTMFPTYHFPDDVGSQPVEASPRRPPRQAGRRGGSNTRLAGSATPRRSNSKRVTGTPAARS